MKYTLYLLLIFLTLHSYAQNTNQGCSIWRRDVKTLADLTQMQIDNLLNAKPKATTVEELNSEELLIDGTPTQLSNGAKWENVKRQSSENYTVRIIARIVACGKEENDKDYHIVLQDMNTNMQMVAEIPDPDCPDITNESLKKRFQALRTWFNNNIETPANEIKELPAPIIVTIVGIPFWDGKHGEGVHGAALNFREIHPILKFVTQSGQEIPFMN
jgi:hypothetical protein